MNVKDSNLLSAASARVLDIAKSLTEATVKTRKTAQDAADLKILAGLIVSEVKKLPEMK